MNLTQSFENQVQVVLDDLRTAFPLDEIEAEMRSKKALSDQVTSVQFRALFLAFLTAQVSQRWRLCCDLHRIDAKETQNLFFKKVLDRYAAAKDLEGAAYFSEALYAANAQADQPTLISILTAFFRKIGLAVDASAESTAENFRWMAGIWEGYCHHFENEFDDFVGQLRLHGAFTQEKRG